ncbi:Putative cytochrome c [hydrothermal vent metagenome]|uniref:Cytochrome c n=1 Tax=hydrothermal vent metagenome TaxID=652676 RepID=A0A3B1DVV5_9ZZZZ
MHTFKRTSLTTATFAIVTAFSLLQCSYSYAKAPQLQFSKGNKIVFIGNTLAERMQHAGYFETLIQSRFPYKELTFRNLGWSADELKLRPRSNSFSDHGHRLEDHKPDVVFAFFGFNESFGGKKGLPKFQKDLKEFIKKITTTKYNGKSAPQLVLVSPIAHENLHKPSLPDGKANNKNIALYTKAMKEIAEKQNVVFVNVFDVTQKMMETSETSFTFNGIHLNDYGNKYFATALDMLLFGAQPKNNNVDTKKLRAEVLEKNLQHWYDYRAVNGFYIYGGRKKPFGVVNFPAEFKKLRKMVVNRDKRIWAVARGNKVPDKIDDSNTGKFTEIKTNFKRPITILSPAESKKHFKLPKGYEINLFASEVEFPALKNPCQFTFDAKGRLWVVTMETYPMYLPGTPVHDKVLILEDTNGDGKADKSTVFADGLHLPTGIELGDGGAYVAQQPNLVFLKDTNGDGKADVKKIVLHGFDSADSHHSISAFEWGPGGALYFQEGTFHHSQVETPYGPTRLVNSGIFRYEPKSEKLDAFVSYNFANPWGHLFDKWGQNLVADASGGANYFGTAFSGDIDYPKKHASMKHFLKKQWRPTSGCEIVSSRNFPESAQGNYLLNNCIGFHGVLQYKMKDDGSGFHADPVEPLVQSTDTNFRPVDLQFGPDGALYLVDWFNPLVGHMQHSIRDPNRDHAHGRIWRVSYKNRPLVKPAKIAGEPIMALLDLLKSPEDRTRFRVRRELRLHKTKKVVRAIDKWIAKLDKKDKNYQHHLLEALWVNQHHDVVDEILLKQLLQSPDFRVRAAATRVLCYWRDRVEKPLDLLRKQINDKHPRVRIEAIRALSFFKGDQAAEALEVSVDSLLLPQDYYLKYTLQETMNTLEGRVKKK